MGNQAAPDRLEAVRVFLNTWEISNDTRNPVDYLSSEEEISVFIQQNFAEHVLQNNLDEILRFRTALRTAIEIGEVETLNQWFQDYPVQTKLGMDGDIPVVIYSPSNSSFISKVLVVIVEAVSKGQWQRLKACPDCQWVFYDHSRNASKRWCGMYAQGPTGRACGTIAKVKRYREKQQNC